MVNSDSDDELMIRLTRTMSMRFSTDSDKDCAYCAVNDASMVCIICNKTFFCNELRMKNLSRMTDLLDIPDAMSPNDFGRTIQNFEEYFKLKSMEMPIDQISMKMEGDGVDPALLDKPSNVSPNDVGASRTAIAC
ncbi:hypothetical protein KXD40_001519 [Peronospora effusa]|nr:hypothetical protein KXD40_001519 [Peronospora effusa]